MGQSGVPGVPIAAGKCPKLSQKGVPTGNAPLARLNWDDTGQTKAPDR